jgi:signal transduction histidine kinase
MQIESFLNNSEFRTGIEEKSSIHPFFTASIIGIVYIILISFYIWLSGKYAAEAAYSLENLHHIELTKGLLFAIVTGLLLFISLYVIFVKLKKRDEIIIARNKSIISSEGLVISGLFSSSVYHDINNMLTVILGNSQLLKLSEEIPSREKKYVYDILTAAQNLKDLSRKIIDAAKGHISDKKDLVDLTVIIKDTINFAKIHSRINGCNLHSELPPGLEARINSMLFSRALMNLILNAADATGNSGEILIKLSEDSEMIILEVNDNGPGIPNEIKDNILSPFFTTKKDGNGLGLLSLKIFLDQHNGSIDIRRSELGGACFSISFPKTDYSEGQ